MNNFNIINGISESTMRMEALVERAEKEYKEGVTKAVHDFLKQNSDYYPDGLRLGGDGRNFCGYYLEIYNDDGKRVERTFLAESNGYQYKPKLTMKLQEDSVEALRHIASCVERIADMLNRRFAKALNGAKILVLGVAYKQDIDDYRESPAIRVIDGLRSEGADVVYYDPFVRHYRHKGEWFDGESELNAELIENADAVVITTAHTKVDYSFVQQHAKAIFDTKNAMKAIAGRDNIEVL